MGMSARFCAGTIWYHDLAGDDSEWQVPEGSVSGKAALQVNVGHGGGDAAWLPTPGIGDSLEKERWQEKGLEALKL